MMFAPLEGWRRVTVTDRHTAIDYAHVLRELSDTHCPNAVKIVLVQDNLNIHKPASLYEAFPAPEARRLVERFEWHYTPRHGSWLDLAESELSVLASQCLARRIADKQIVAREVTAWQDHRNKHHATMCWCKAGVSQPGGLCAKKRGALLKIGGSFFRGAFFRPGVQNLGVAFFRGAKNWGVFFPSGS
jgi:DDE superfamily endonuclease